MKWGAFIGGVALAAVSSLPAALSPAHAADMSVHPAAPPVTYIPTPYFWTGYYVGIAAGYGWGTAPFTDPFAASTATPKIKGFLTGGVTGINYQVGWAVFGAEFDFIGTWIKGSAVDSFNDNLQSSVYWTSSLTARLGVAFDRVMVFAKGGGAFDFDKAMVMLANGTTAAGSTNRAGWTVGGGVEYAITDHWIGRFEYDFLKFSTKGFMFSGLPNNNGGGQVGINLNEIKVVSAYKF